MPVHIEGLQKLTLLDYPGRMACTVFLGGCNFRCPFCHNSDLLAAAEAPAAVEEAELLAFLRRRQGILDGVCVDVYKRQVCCSSAHWGCTWILTLPL